MHSLRPEQGSTGRHSATLGWKAEQGSKHAAGKRAVTSSLLTLMPSRPAKMMKLPDSSNTTFGVGACRSNCVLH